MEFKNRLPTDDDAAIAKTVIIPKKLTPGREQPSFTPEIEKARVLMLRATVEHYLPEFGAALAGIIEHKVDMLILHQDSFAAGYHDDEYTLLGMVVKYAGLFGVRVQFIGTNHETF